MINVQLIQSRAINELRNLIFPLFTDQDLTLVLDACQKRDSRLVQQETVRVDDDCGTVLGACFIGYMAWQSRGISDPNEIESFFDRIRNRVCDKGGSMLFVEWFDFHPDINEVFRVLTYELNRELARRNHVESMSAISCESVAEGKSSNIAV